MITQTRIDQIREKIMLSDFPHCAILDPNQVARQLNITDQEESELIFNLVKHVNILVQ